MMWREAAWQALILAMTVHVKRSMKRLKKNRLVQRLQHELSQAIYESPLENLKVEDGIGTLQKRIPSETIFDEERRRWRKHSPEWNNERSHSTHSTFPEGNVPGKKAFGCEWREFRKVLEEFQLKPKLQLSTSQEFRRRTSANQRSWGCLDRETIVSDQLWTILLTTWLEGLFISVMSS